VSLGGSSYAAIKIGSKNIKRGAVNSRAIANNSVRGSDVRNSTLTGADVKNNSLKNADIDNTTLQANTAKRADTATTAANANALGGIAASGFTRPDCASQTGSVKGFARIDVAATAATFSTAGVENPYNCSGGTIEAQKIGTGVYDVRFNGASSVLALVSVLYTSNSSFVPANSTTVVSAGTFRVKTFDAPLGGLADNVPFVIAVL
jgi:hypothetical protein